MQSVYEVYALTQVALFASYLMVAAGVVYGGMEWASGLDTE